MASLGFLRAWWHRDCHTFYTLTGLLAPQGVVVEPTNRASCDLASEVTACHIAVFSLPANHRQIQDLVNRIHLSVEVWLGTQGRRA